MGGIAPLSARVRNGGGVVPSDIRVRRVYDAPSAADGARVLVDRIWPRGLRKDAAHLTEWAKDAAPSTELRKWYGHDPAKFDEFRRRYLDELSGRPQRAELARLRTLAADRSLTLLTATRDVDISQAAVLAQILRQDVEPDDGGDAVCWAHLVCPDCGAIETEGHREGCNLASA
jgi:uncharacterized protein YeaO (DUF488 family)